jgi:hypothetical protein
MLSHRGVINLKVVKDHDYRSGLLAPPFLLAVIDDSIRVIYDTADSSDIDTQKLALCEVYFKRSYDPAIVTGLKEDNKIYPLGFNYPVYAKHDFSWFQNSWNFMTDKSFLKKDAFRQYIRTSTLWSRLLRPTNGRFDCSAEALEGLPLLSREPIILFFARLWDPKRAKRSDLEDERHYINTMRVECIRKLKAQFGSLFSGGLEPNEFAINHYPDYVVPDPTITRKHVYLRNLKRASICVATMGLQQSNGWKLGEYIAGAKAIVTEKLYHCVPGDFNKGMNYLEFETPDQCVSGVQELVEDPGKRYAMMKRNFDYYHSYLRPDILVLNSLLIALQKNRTSK